MKKRILLMGIALLTTFGAAHPDYTALHLAAQQGNSRMVKKLIEKHNIDPDEQDANGNTALHIAGQLRKRKIFNFLMLKTDLTIKNEKGEKPHYYSKGGTFKVKWKNRNKRAKYACLKTFRRVKGR